MGLFSKKKTEQIPEVGGGFGGSQRRPVPSNARPSSPAPSSVAPSYRSTAPSYVPPSQGGQGYGDAQKSYYDRPGAVQSYASGPGPAGAQPPPPPLNDPKASKGRSWFGGQKARDELLAGAPPAGAAAAAGGSAGQGGSSQYRGGGGGHSSYGGSGASYGDGYSNGGSGGYRGAADGNNDAAGDLDEDEEVEGIKQQMRFVKQESLASTRNAVRIAREAEETARATLDKLGDQSDRIANTERHLDLAKAHNDRAVDETKELEALNRSIFRPNFTLNKSAKRDREERRILDRHNAEKAEREQTRRDQYESRQRIDQTYQNMDRQADNSAMARSRAKARSTGRERFQFEATASDDEVEDEIDQNLDEMSNVVGRLKMLATTAGQEVDSQNQKLGKLSNKVDVLDNNVVRSTQRLARVK